MKFEDLSFKKFVDKKTLEIDGHELVKTVKNHSQMLNLDEGEILQQLRGLQDEDYPVWQICCGHDLVELLSIGLCKLFGSCNSNDVTSEKLERALRLAYEYAFFQQTNLYRELKAWESQHEQHLFLS